MKISEGVEFVDRIVPYKELTIGTVLFLAKSRETRMKFDLYYPVHLVGFSLDCIDRMRLIIREDGKDQIVNPEMLCFDLPGSQSVPSGVATKQYVDAAIKSIKDFSENCLHS